MGLVMLCFAAVSCSSSALDNDPAEYGGVDFIGGVPVYNLDLQNSIQEGISSEQADWLVSLKAGTSNAQLLDLCSDLPGEAKCTFHGHPSEGGAAIINLRASASELEECLTMYGHIISFAEPDGQWSAIPDLPEDLSNPSVDGALPWGLDRIDARFGLDGSYQSTANGGKGVHVYVLDTGIRTTHEDFRDANGSLRAFPTLEVQGNGVVECNAADTSCAADGHGHGTHCAGTIGGSNYGVAKGASLHAVKVLSDSGSGSWSWFISAVDWVATKGQRPAIISASLGGGGRSASVEKAVNAAVAAGVTVVVAAGNDRGDACTKSPAFVPSAITVGATDKNDNRADFSNYGKCLDIFAPGVDVLSTWTGSDKATKSISGTSMACPHVSGAAALLLEQDESLSPSGVSQQLQLRATGFAIKDVKKDSPNLLLYVGDDPPRTWTTTTTTPKPLTPASGFCGFESSAQPFCGIWHQSTLDEFDWTRQSSRTPSSGTGPSKAYGGSYFVYTEASTPRQNGDEAILQALTPTLKSGSYLSFFYNMEGTSMGTLKVEAQSMSTGETKLLWSKSGNQGSQWQQQTVSLDSYAGDAITISFVGIRGSDWSSDIAIDDVMLSPERWTGTTTTTTTRPWSYFMMPKGSCCCSDQDRISTKAECEKAHDALGLHRHTVWKGATGSIPGGCSTRQSHSHDLHWNTAEPGSARSDMTPICRSSSTTTESPTTTKATTSTITTTVTTTTTITTTTSTSTTTTTTTTKTSTTSTATTTATTRTTATTTTTTTTTATKTMTTTSITTTASETTTSSTPGGIGIKSGDTVFLKTRSGSGNHIDVEGSKVQARWQSQGNFQAIVIEKKDDQKGDTVNSGDTVYLKTHTGAHIDITGQTVQARWHDQGQWQAMVIEKRTGGHGAILPGDSVCFKAHTGKHLDVEGAVVRARWDDCGEWQAMVIQREVVGALFSGASIHLLAHTGKHIEVEDNAVRARWTDHGQWQTFVIENYGGRAIFSGDAVFLKAHTDAFVHVDGVAVQAAWQERGEWQKLFIERKHGSGAVMPGDTIFLRAHTGKMIEVEGEAVQARWDDKGRWQSLIIEKSNSRRLAHTANVLTLV